MQIISVYNQSGGAGKTTTVREVGYQLARRGRRVLLVDLDPQASLTRGLGLLDDPASPAHLLTSTVFVSAVDPRAPLPGALIPPQVPELRVLPANAGLEALDGVLYADDRRLGHLGAALRGLSGYDTVLIDTPPALGGITRAALAASDALIVPVASSLKGLENFDSVSEVVDGMRRFSPGLRVALFVVTGFDPRVRHDQEVLTLLRTRYASVAPTASPVTFRKAIFNDVGIARTVVPLYRPKDAAARELSVVTDELLAALAEVSA